MKSFLLNVCAARRRSRACGSPFPLWGLGKKRLGLCYRYFTPYHYHAPYLQYSSTLRVHGANSTSSATLCVARSYVDMPGYGAGRARPLYGEESPDPQSQKGVG